jgi:uncharacterized protein GlcG (DUF336 family)
MVMMTLDKAQLAEKAAVAKAQEIGQPSDIAVVDAGANLTTTPWVMIFAGDIPIKENGEIVGAVGLSGGSGAQDQTIAEAAVAAFP